jgi:hypothetical protein
VSAATVAEQISIVEGATVVDMRRDDALTTFER